jgi:protein-tyrosine sulfotransferase
LLRAERGNSTMSSEDTPIAGLHAQKNPKQIFILSLPRSGSTLLRMILDTHAQVCCPAELSLGQLCTDLYHSLYFSIGQASTQNETARLAIVKAKVREIVDGFMKSYAALKGKTIWAEKTPANIEQVDTLHETFPQAAYICLHRNLLDVIRSGWESTRFGKLRYELWDYQSGVELIIRHTRALLDFERKHQGQVIRLHYEQLAQNAAQQLPRLFSFLNLDWDSSLLDAVFKTQHDQGPGDPKVEFATNLYTTSIGRGTTMEVLSEIEKMPKHLQNALNDLLCELGYADLHTAFRAASQNSTVSAVAAPTTNLGACEVSELFTHHFRDRFAHNQQRAADLKGIAKFIVRGTGGGTWTINLDACPPMIAAMDQEADCTITIKADDLMKLASGQLNVGECYLQARLRVAGNEGLAISLGRTLFA